MKVDVDLKLEKKDEEMNVLNIKINGGEQQRAQGILIQALKNHIEVLTDEKDELLTKIDTL